VFTLSNFDVRLFGNEGCLVECGAIFTDNSNIFSNDHTAFLLRANKSRDSFKLLESEDESAKILRNIVNYLPEVFAVLEYWAALFGILLQTFRNSLPVPPSRVKLLLSVVWY
jgi:hypothetical protein